MAPFCAPHSAKQAGRQAGEPQQHQSARAPRKQIQSVIWEQDASACKPVSARQADRQLKSAACCSHVSAGGFLWQQLESLLVRACDAAESCQCQKYVGDCTSRSSNTDMCKRGSGLEGIWCHTPSNDCCPLGICVKVLGDMLRWVIWAAYMLLQQRRKLFVGQVHCLQDSLLEQHSPGYSTRTTVDRQTTFCFAEATRI